MLVKRNGFFGNLVNLVRVNLVNVAVQVVVSAELEPRFVDL